MGDSVVAAGHFSKIRCVDLPVATHQISQPCHEPMHAAFIGISALSSACSVTGDRLSIMSLVYRGPETAKYCRICHVIGRYV